MTAFGTLIEGNWDQLCSLARECHFRAKQTTDRVLTMIRLDDYGDRIGEIDGAVTLVEAKAWPSSEKAVRRWIRAEVESQPLGDE